MNDYKLCLMPLLVLKQSTYVKSTYTIDMYVSGLE